MKAAVAAFKILQDEFHQKSNDAKNASLYVDFDDGAFIAPIERITDTMLVDTANRNETFIGSTRLMVELLLKWENSRNEAQQARERGIAFIKLAEATKAENPKDPIASIEKLVWDFVEVESEKSKAKSNFLVVQPATEGWRWQTCWQSLRKWVGLTNRRTPT